MLGEIVMLWAATGAAASAARPKAAIQERWRSMGDFLEGGVDTSGATICHGQPGRKSTTPRANARGVVYGLPQVLVPPAHAATAARHRRGRLVCLPLHDHALGREQEARDRCRVLQRGAGDLGRVDHAGLDQVLVRVGAGVVAEVLVLRLLHPRHDDRALDTGVRRDDADRLLDGAAHDVDADLLVLGAADLRQHRLGADERHAATGDDALFHGGARRVQRVLDPGLLLLHLGLGGRADVDDRNATAQLGEPLLQFLTVVVAGALLDGAADLADAALDVGLLALAVHHRRIVLVDHDALGAAEIVERRVLELEPDFLRDDLAAGEDGDVAEHFLPAVAEARGLDGCDLERPAELVDHERRERLALDVFGDDEQRTAALRDLLEDREQILHRADLLVVDQDVGVLEHG